MNDINNIELLLKQNTEAYYKLSQTIDCINQTMIELRQEIVEQKSITHDLVDNVSELKNRVDRIEDLSNNKGLLYCIKKVFGYEK